MQTAALNGSNASQTQFAPTFLAAPEPMTLLGAGAALAFGAGFTGRQAR